MQVFSWLVQDNLRAIEKEVLLGSLKTLNTNGFRFEKKTVYFHVLFKSSSLKDNEDFQSSSE